MNDQMLHHFMEDLLPLVVITTMVIAGAWLLSLLIAAFKNRTHLRAQSDFHNRMMDKFSSVAEFTVYLQSEAGRSFFENLTSEPSTPLNKILSSIQKGAVLTLLGFGLFVLGNKYTAQEGGNIMFVMGTIAFMTGLGFLVSSVVSYRLAKTWGMITADKGTATDKKPHSAP